MSSHVAIPIINVTTPTPSPDLAPNPLHAEPLESNVGEAISNLGAHLQDVAQQQQDHANAIDVAQRMGAYVANAGQAKVAALNSGKTMPQMVANYQAALAQLQEQTVGGTENPQNPPNRAVARQLQLMTAQHIGQEQGSFPAEAAQRVYHDLDFKFQQQNSAAAAQIGQNYVINGTADNPSFEFNSAGDAAAKLAAQTIDNAYPPDSRKTENQFYRQQLAEKIALQTGVAVAQDHPSLIDSYIKQHANLLTPEQQMQLTNRATAAIDLPMRQINANNAATRAQLLTKYDQQAVNGNLDTAQLEHDARFRLITPEDYEHYAGIPLAQPSDPGAVAAMTTAIQGARTPEELDDLRASIAGNQLIRGKDSVMLPIQIENAKRQMATPAGKALIAGEETIREAFDPKTPAEALNQKIADKIAPGVRANALRKALANFRVSTFKETDPAKINAAALSASPPPASSRPAASASTPAPAPPPPAVTDDVAKKAAALARERGLIH